MGSCTTDWILINNNLLLQWGNLECLGSNHVAEQVTLPLTYTNVFIPIFSVRSGQCTTTSAEGSPRCRVDDLSHAYFYSGMTFNREGFFWFTIGI